MKVSVDCINDNLVNLFEIVGSDKFLEIAKLYGGNTLYIPTFNSVIREGRNEDIRKRFNGVNADVLAREYGISVNHIKKIISE